MRLKNILGMMFGFAGRGFVWVGCDGEARRNISGARRQVLSSDGRVGRWCDGEERDVLQEILLRI